ncbi:serine/threonine-protein kinase atg1-like [Convolutriloba macropyga]|uniref:serine/threonine-protein kinase atg1-like n=1 Tax=Convolutriloba macropyga TaxID=536237 RepID=UPI003F5254B1
MELCDSNLENYIEMKEKKVHPIEVSHFLKQMANGLKFIHDHGFIHRDLKPNNILLKVNAGQSLESTNFRSIVAKIGDLGLITKVPDFNLPPSSGGNILYLAPERRQKGATYNQKSDIWSLGLIVYECLGGSEHTNSHGKANEFKIPLGAPHDLSDLLQNMLKKEPNSRYNINQILKHRFLN